MHDPLTGLPDAVRIQLADLVEILAALLGQNLAGIYLTGTPPAFPDNDAAPALRLLTVTVRELRRDTKLGLLQALLRRSRQPAVLELLIVRHGDLLATDALLPIQLHFAEGRRAQFTTDTQSLLWLNWPDGPSGAIDRATLSRQLQPDPIALVGPALSARTVAPPLTLVETTERMAPDRPALPHSGTQLPFGEGPRP